MGLFNNLFGKKKITLEEGEKIHEKAYAMAPPANDEDGLVKQATKLMVSKKFTESIQVYETLVEQFPNNKALYQSQIGVGHHFLGDYNKAIDYYLLAMRHGSDKDMMDDNVWEAIEALHQQTKDVNVFEKYKQLFPAGNYVKKADKFLGAS
jgi:tetratricopeptide (TPR) repeat protein